MNFNFYLLKSARILLFPFSLIYGWIIIVRNYLFDKGFFHSTAFPLPTIGIGNLSVGGTGKSPMVEYLVTLLQPAYRIATLSRGYGRASKGYLLANKYVTALEIGDEPMQFHLKFPGLAVAVGEDRVASMHKLLKDRPETEIVLLDDCFQHRKIKPGFNILLTSYNNLFTRDFFLPTGSLRDQKSSYQRADVVVVTKCPADLSTDKMLKIKTELHLLPNQKAFFTVIDYGKPYALLTKEERLLTLEDEVLLLTGIANPDPLKKYLSDKVKRCYEMSFKDHHTYTRDDVEKVIKNLASIATSEKIILTTEKDAARLIEFMEDVKSMPLYVLPVRHRFLFGEGIQFDEIVDNFIETFQARKKI